LSRLLEAGNVQALRCFIGGAHDGMMRKVAADIAIMPLATRRPELNPQQSA